MATEAMQMPSLADIRVHGTDTGSTQVQVTTLTKRILHLTEHFKTHKKDKHSKRGLINLVNRRKKLLRYFKANNPNEYIDLIKKLSLRDSY